MHAHRPTAPAASLFGAWSTNHPREALGRTPRMPAAAIQSLQAIALAGLTH